MTVPQRRAWLLPAVVAVCLLVAVAEVWLLTAVGSRIGFLPTVGILVVEALVGSWLLRREGSRAWRALTGAYESGRMPAGELADAALVLVGGVMFILPGFFTDVIGLFFLLPITRPLARKTLGFLIARQAARSGVNYDALKAKYAPGTVIKGETVPEESSANPTGQSGTESKSQADPLVIKGEIEP